MVVKQGLQTATVTVGELVKKCVSLGAVICKRHLSPGILGYVYVLPAVKLIVLNISATRDEISRLLSSAIVLLDAP